uniref:Uncharacterized protein n=1 Tax=Rhizophora mucronata TaxID=61149 RepID=A0A2P2MM45_RHIMU
MHSQPQLWIMNHPKGNSFNLNAYNILCLCKLPSKQQHAMELGSIVLILQILLSERNLQMGADVFGFSSIKMMS